MDRRIYQAVFQNSARGWLAGTGTTLTVNASDISFNAPAGTTPSVYYDLSGLEVGASYAFRAWIKPLWNEVWMSVDGISRGPSVTAVDGENKWTLMEYTFVATATTHRLRFNANKSLTHTQYQAIGYVWSTEVYETSGAPSSMDFHADKVRLEVEVPTTGLQNLVKNPDAEKGTWFWESPVANTSLYVNEVWASFEFKTNAAQAAYWISEPMAVSAGRYLSMRFDAVMATTNTNVKVRFLFYDSAKALISTGTQSAAFAGDFATKWFSGGQVPANTAFVRVRFDMYRGTANPGAGDSFTFRRVMVTHAATNAEFAGYSKTNKVTNPSFATNLSGWASDNAYSVGSRITTGGAQGATYCRIAPTNANTKTNIVAIQQQIASVTGGKDYTVSGYFLYPSGFSAVRAFMKVTWIDADGKQFANNTYLGNITMGNTWQRNNATFTAPSNAVRAILSIGAKIDSGTFPAGQGVGVDGIMLQEGITLEPYFEGTMFYPQHPYTDAVEWRNILGPTQQIEVTRKGLDVGLLSADIKDALLDPADSDTIRPGKRVRLRALVGTVWESVFEGVLTSAKVTYDKKKNIRSKIETHINITAADAMATLANHGESRGVARIVDLPHILEGKGVPWSVNGSGNQISTANVVTYNDNASTVDQIAVTRDSAMGFAFVDRNNVLVAMDREFYYNETWTEEYMFADEPYLNAYVSYSDIDVDFDLEQCINSVEIKWLRYDIGTGQTEEVSYGPYIDQESIDTWGARSATFTIQGATESAALIQDYADSVLSANALPYIKVNSLKMPVRNPKELEVAATYDLYDSPYVSYGEKVNDFFTITEIKHVITPEKWTVEYGFGDINSVAVPTFVPSPPFVGITPPEDTGWVTPSLSSGWTNAVSSGWDVPGYRRIGDEVYLRGAVVGGTISTAPFFLPTHCRPSRNRSFIVSSSHSSGTSRLQIRASDGAVYLDQRPVGGSGQSFFIDCAFAID